MAQPLAPRRPGRAVTKFSHRALLVGGVGLLALVMGALLLPTLWRRTPTVAAKEQPQEQPLKLPEVISRPLPPRTLVAASAIAQDPAPIVQRSEADTTPETGKAARQQSFLDTLNPFAKQGAPAHKAAHTTTQPPTTPATTQQPVPTPPKEAKPRKGWAVLATPKQREAGAAVPPLVLSGQEDMPTVLPVAAQTQQGAAGAQDLIHAARWAIPENPLKTIYRSQTLTGVLLQAVHSEKPGQVVIQLTTPVFNKFGYDVIILPKGTLVIATQAGRTQYGDSRLGLKIEQLELPTGEVVDLRATVGDDAGTNGMQGKVNNHYGKLILGVGLNALLNIGVKSAVGTPGRNQFFRNPLEDAAQDVGQAAQSAATDIMSRELQVNPTITIPAGTFCTINLLENMQFHRPPVVAR